MKEAILYEKLNANKVKCNVCQIRCVIPDGECGSCGTRLNNKGILYTLIYGLVSSVAVDPIEKKPLFHFYPATRTLSMGALGCNFKCPGCQNWGISHEAPDKFGKNMQDLTPAQSIAIAKSHKCEGLSWTYNEPAIWLEHTLESAKLAFDEGLYTTYITNGYASPEALDIIGPYLGAYRVDIKGFSKETYRKISGIAKFESILDVTKRAKSKWNMHIECVTNITPTINDDDKELRDIARWIKNEIGEYTPWHVTRFYPHLDLSNIPPTPIRKLEKVCDIGHEEGLKYIYIGNVPGHSYEDTFCHNCKKVVIKRDGFSSQSFLANGKCPHCKTEIPGRWQLKK